MKKVAAAILIVAAGALAILALPSLAGAMPTGTGKGALGELHRWIYAQGVTWGIYLGTALLLGLTGAINVQRIANNTFRALLLVVLICLPNVVPALAAAQSAREILQALTTSVGLVLWFDLLRRHSHDLGVVLARNISESEEPYK